MSKNKRQDSQKNNAADDFLDLATAGLKKFRRFTKQVNKLSTTQKIVGGLAVLAAGYALVTNTSPNQAPAEALALDEPPLPPGALPVSPTRSPARASRPKRTKSTGPTKHVPFSEEPA